MSVIPQTEGNPAGAGGANANLTPSDPQSQPSLEEQLAALRTTLDATAKKLDAHDGTLRALQSGKDKAVDRAVGELQPLKETVAKIAKHLGISEDAVLKAQRELVLEDLVAERMSGGLQPQGNGSGIPAPRGNAVELQYVDLSLDLPTNDSRVTQLKLDYGNDPQAYITKAKELKASLAGSTPTPAEQPLPGGSSPRPLGSDELTKKYQRDMLAARGNKAELRRIKEQAIRDGVPVNSIAFV